MHSNDKINDWVWNGVFEIPTHLGLMPQAQAGPGAQDPGSCSPWGLGPRGAKKPVAKGAKRFKTALKRGQFSEKRGPKRKPLKPSEKKNGGKMSRFGGQNGSKRPLNGGKSKRKPHEPSTKTDRRAVNRGQNDSMWGQNDSKRPLK